MGNCWAGAGAVRTVAMGTSILPWSTGDCVCTEAKTEKKGEWAFYRSEDRITYLRPLLYCHNYCSKTLTSRSRADNSHC